MTEWSTDQEIMQNNNVIIIKSKSRVAFCASVHDLGRRAEFTLTVVWNLHIICTHLERYVFIYKYFLFVDFFYNEINDVPTTGIILHEKSQL